jgi:hypothetical protein
LNPNKTVIARSEATKQSRLQPRLDCWIASLRSQ